MHSTNPESLVRAPSGIRARVRAGGVWPALWALTLALRSFAQEPAFTYQGRVQESGTNFTGLGQFKFALVTTSNLSFTTLWSNDGSSNTGSEPTSSVPVTVNAGLFSIGIGDSSLPNMQPVPPAALTVPHLA